MYFHGALILGSGWMGLLSPFFWKVMGVAMFNTILCMIVAGLTQIYINHLNEDLADGYSEPSRILP
jgi:hypothetical protein